MGSNLVRHLGFSSPERLLPRAWSAVGPAVRLEPHGRAVSTSRMHPLCLTHKTGSVVSGSDSQHRNDYDSKTCVRRCQVFSNRINAPPYHQLSFSLSFTIASGEKKGLSTDLHYLDCDLRKMRRVRMQFLARPGHSELLTFGGAVQIRLSG